MLEQGDIETPAKSVNQPSSAKAQPDESGQKRAAVDEQLQELRESHRREVTRMAESFKKQISEHERRCLQEISRAEESSRNQLLEQHKRFKEELSKKEEQMKLRLSQNEGFCREKLPGGPTNVSQKPSRHERAMAEQLSGIQGTLETMTAELCRQWGVREQQWSRHQQQLEEMRREEKARQQLEETTRLQIQYVQEEVLQLKGLIGKKSNKNSFWRNLSSVFRGKQGSE